MAQDRSSTQRSAVPLRMCLEPLESAEQIDAVRADQQRHWLGGERLTIETYLAALPYLEASQEAVLDLIYGEILLREQQGETPHPEEYQARFPQFREDLQRLFLVHQTVPQQHQGIPWTVSP
jgi:hypothetical protein